MDFLAEFLKEEEPPKPPKREVDYEAIPHALATLESLRVELSLVKAEKGFVPDPLLGIAQSVQEHFYSIHYNDPSSENIKAFNWNL